MSYTLAQFTAFLEADYRLEHEQAHLQLILTAVASQGDNKAIERLQKELSHAR